MTLLMKGGPVADRLTEYTKAKAEKLKSEGTVPTLAILRVGKNSDDISYEKGIVNKAARAGVNIIKYEFDQCAEQSELTAAIKDINENESIHGVLMLMPLPDHIDEEAVCETLACEKDVDGVTSDSLAGVFTNSSRGFPPCTAEAVIEMLDYYNLSPEGRRITIYGRSLIVGRPLSQMLMNRNGTVTVCHSRTDCRTASDAGRSADIVIAAVGKACMIGRDMLGSNQVIIDVGINTDCKGKICGDVNFDEVEDDAKAITPVPGGVGNVTTAVLMKHVADAAEKAVEKQRREIR